MYTVSLYQVPLHIKNPLDRKASAQKIKTKSNSDPTIYMKNPSQQRFKGTRHNTSYNSNTNSSFKEVRPRTEILPLLTVPLP